jgi:MoaA/NifB/PqqE/SkfB family radical SAM enzyme
MVVCNKNYQKIPELVRLAHRLGVQELLLNALNVWRPEIETLKLNEVQERRLIPILRRSQALANQLGVSSNMAQFLQDRLFEKANVMDEVMVSEVGAEVGFTTIPCYYPWYNMAIFPNGMVQACFIPKEKGEFVTAKSLEQIWFGRYFQRVREELLTHRLSEDCSKCNPWNLAKMREIRKKLAQKLRN